jgi:formylglycine-generating enzyme required for sulfatase activity
MVFWRSFKTCALAITLLVVALVGAFQAQAATNRTAVAVIIGNKTYNAGVPSVDFAGNDASAMHRFVVENLGYREGNVIDLRDARLSDLIDVFGNRETHEGKLWQWVKTGKSDVTVFYSGHGVPGLKDRRGYLLPVDASPARPELGGYPLDLLYSNLAQLKARSVTVYIDACFSGNSQKGMLIQGISAIAVEPRPLKETGGLIILTAAEGDQVASWDEEAKHGLFTKHLLDALNGAADGEGYGNGDHKVTVGEIKRYLDEEMTYAAKRSNGWRQTASVQGQSERVLAILMPSTTVRKERVAPVIKIEELDATYVVLKTANLREAPTTGSEKVGLLPTDAAVNVTGRVKGQKWLRVAHAGGAAFVFAPLLSAIDQAEVEAWQALGRDPGREKLQAYLSRFGDGHFAARARVKLAVLPMSVPPKAEPGYRVTALSKPMKVDAPGAVVRNEPDGTATSITRLSADEDVEVTGKVDGRRWYRVAMVGGRIGFVFASELTETPPVPIQPAVGVFSTPDRVLEAKSYNPGDTFKDCDVCPEMVVVPAGEFMMGSSEVEQGRESNEGPRHRVRILKPFAVGKYEITVAQFRTFVEATFRENHSCIVLHRKTWRESDSNSWRDPGYPQSDDHPVVCVNWEDAKSYISWLNKKSGKIYRLLSEAEWEYVARAGTTDRRYWGDDPGESKICKYGNGLGAGTQFGPGNEACVDGQEYASRVGRFLPNKWKLYDVIGNVSEWTEDCWRGNYLGAANDSETETSGACNEGVQERVLRGGSWLNKPNDLRSASRFKIWPLARGSFYGFRVTRNLSR